MDFLNSEYLSEAEDEQEVIRDMRKQDCLHQIYSSNSSLAETECPRVWDGILCWPPSLPDTLQTLPCPAYVVGFDPQMNATKACTPQGTWFVRIDTLGAWTNYSQCSSDRLTWLVIRFPDIHNSSLVAQYVPLMKAVSRLGYAVSLITVVVALCVLVTFKKLRCPRNNLHMHLFISFILRASTALLKDVLFVKGVGLPSDFVFWDGEEYFLLENEHNWKCKLITSFWQYFIMCNYCWLLMEGIYLHNLIFLSVFTDTSSITSYVILGWGLPLVFVTPWVAARSLWENTLCWTLNDNPNVFLIIKIPITFAVLVNFILFLNIVRLLRSKLTAEISERSKILRYRRWAKSTLILVPLFGVHYAGFFVLSYLGVGERLELVWLLIDQLFTSFQGFLVAVLYCLLNGDVRFEVKKQWRAWSLLGRRKPPQRHIFPRHHENPCVFLDNQRESITIRLHTSLGK